MKNTLIKKVLTVLLISGISFSCHKDKIDYRDKFVGKFEFSVAIYSFNTSTNYSFKDTIIYPGSISYGTNDSQIVIKYLPDDSLKPNVSENGSFESLTGNEDIKGNFESYQKIIFNRYRGGLGGGTSHNVTGIKKYL